MFGRPVVNSVMLMPWMPSDVAAWWPKSDWNVKGTVRAKPTRSSLTSVFEITRV